MDLSATPAAYPYSTRLIRLGASMAIAGQLATLPPQRQAKLSCVRETCAAPSPCRKQPKGYYFVPARSMHKRQSSSTTLTPPRRKRTSSVVTLSSRSEGPATPNSPPVWWTQRSPKATPFVNSMVQTPPERWDAYW